jgi:hypothetical protein
MTEKLNMTTENILAIYEKLKDLSHNDLKSDEITFLLLDLYKECMTFINRSKIKALNSFIPNKEYFCFEWQNKKSRAINKELFIKEVEVIKTFKESFINMNYKNNDPQLINNAIYSIAISFCAIIDLIKNGDQKTPGTYFEYLIGHLYAKRMNINPRKRVEVLNLDKKATLPTDYIIDLGGNKAKFHLPIKTSTRERVIQVWAHQRVLDGVYGAGRFIGILTCLSETKTSAKNNQVVDICLPDQWLIYQLFIAQMKRIYYLDIPQKYKELNNSSPKIIVKQFGEFFSEADLLTV